MKGNYENLIRNLSIFSNCIDILRTMANYWIFGVVAFWRRLRACRGVMAAFEATSSAYRGIDQFSSIFVNCEGRTSPKPDLRTSMGAIFVRELFFFHHPCCQCSLRWFICFMVHRCCASNFHRFS